jgi:hypothetical protein
MKTLFEIIQLASIGSPIIGVCLFLYFRKKQEKYGDTLFLFMLISLLCDVISYSLARMKISSVLVVNLFFIIQVLVVSVMYMNILSHHVRTLKAIVVIFFLFVLINGFVQQDFHTIQNINWALSTLIIILIAFYHIAQLSLHPIANVGRHPAFWVSTGIFFYGSLSIFILTVSNYLAVHHGVEDFELAWIFHNSLNIFKNVCFAAAIWWSAKGDVHQLNNVT